MCMKQNRIFFFFLVVSMCISCVQRSKSVEYMQAYQRQYHIISGMCRGELAQHYLLNSGQNPGMCAVIDSIHAFCDDTDSLAAADVLPGISDFSGLERRHTALLKLMEPAFAQHRQPMPAAPFALMHHDETPGLKYIKLKQMNLDVLLLAIHWIRLQRAEYPYMEAGAHRFPEPRIAEAFIEDDSMCIAFVYGVSQAVFHAANFDSLQLQYASGQKRHMAFERNAFGKNGFYAGTSDRLKRVEFVYYVNTGKNLRTEHYAKDME